ncbi:hypothetical protein [Anaerosalibacter massiliensis]|uniref:hypothetical protein n=1 Tax=Anaerosalibacter massiliensis TaxID=1347392 RepID=UPI0005B25F17|nr:hypothetical protein [Anaerosalibacter massiliensis]
MAITLDKKLVLASGELEIKTPNTGVKDMNDVDVYLIKEDGKIFNHSIYPNGLVLQMHQYQDKIIAYSNWDFVKQDDGDYIMVEP